MNVNTIKNKVTSLWSSYRSYVITVIITCILSIGGTIYIIQRGIDSKDRQLQSTVDNYYSIIKQLRENDTKLETDYSNLKSTNSKLEIESERRQGIIKQRDKIISDLTISSGQLESRLDESGKDISIIISKLQSVSSGLTKLTTEIKSSGTIK